LTLCGAAAGAWRSGVPLPAPAVCLPRIGAGITDHALALIRHLESAGVPLTAGSRGVAAAKDKFRCLQALTTAGLPVPRTSIARQPPDEDWAVRAVGGPPVVLKFTTGTHGVGVFLAESAEAARTILDAMWSIERNLLVQEYVAASAGRDLRLFVVGDRVVAAIRRHAPEGSLRSNLHHGGTAEAYEPEPALVEIALRAARAVHLEVAGVDILEGPDGPLVCEVNCSPGLEGIEDATAVDVAGAIADHALARAAER
jgi:ribosomal protein S6--L-glutamate ligase